MKHWLNILSYVCSANIFFIWNFFITVHAMDEPPLELFNMATWRVILMHGASIIDRNTIRNFSEVSRKCKELILETTRYREAYNHDGRALVLQNNKKQYFLNRYPDISTIQNILWNEYGTACAIVSCGSGLRWVLSPELQSKTTCTESSKVLIERRNFLDPSDIIYKAWPYFHKLLPHEPPLRFDGSQDVYFYAYCCSYPVTHDFESNVIEYRLTSKPTPRPDACICMTKICDKYIPLTTFLEFPALLEAFLNSSVTKYTFHIAYKIFLLEGVTIPENYQMWQQYLPRSEYKCFKDLPNNIRTAIVTRYNAQKKDITTDQKPVKKKKRKWFSW